MLQGDFQLAPLRSHCLYAVQHEGQDYLLDLRIVCFNVRLASVPSPDNAAILQLSPRLQQRLQSAEQFHQAEMAARHPRRPGDGDQALGQHGKPIQLGSRSLNGFARRSREQARIASLELAGADQRSQGYLADRPLQVRLLTGGNRQLRR
jgi:hypothetical protein